MSMSMSRESSILFINSNCKILKAIRDTDNEVIKFDGDYIDAYYHLSLSMSQLLLTLVK